MFLIISSFCHALAAILAYFNLERSYMIDFYLIVFLGMDLKYEYRVFPEVV